MTFVVARVDRLFRDAELLASFAKRRFSTLIADMPHLDLRTATGKLALQVLATFAEFERDLIKERTEKGRKLANKAKKAKATAQMSAMSALLRSAVRPPVQAF